MVEYANLLITDSYLAQKLAGEYAKHKFSEIYNEIASNCEDGQHDMHEFIQSLKALAG